MPPPNKLAMLSAADAASTAPTIVRASTSAAFAAPKSVVGWPESPAFPISPAPALASPPVEPFTPVTYPPSPFPFRSLTTPTGPVPLAVSPRGEVSGTISALVGAPATPAGGSAGRAAGEHAFEKVLEKDFGPVSGFNDFSHVSGFNPFVFPPSSTPFSSVPSCFPPTSQSAFPVPSVPFSSPPFSRDSQFVNFQNFVGSTREQPVEVTDSPALGTAARPINLDTPPARVQFTEPAPPSTSRWKGCLFQRLILGLRHHRTALQQLPPQSSEPLRDPISYRTHEDVSQLALDWAVSVDEDPFILEECLLSIARLTGYDPSSLHQDLAKSGNVAFTIISSFASAICAGSPARSIFYAKQCLDILEGDILYQTNMNKQETEKSRSRDLSDDESEGPSSGFDSAGSDSSSDSDSSSSDSSDSSRPRKKKSKIKSKGASSLPPQVSSPASNSTDQLLAALLTRQNHASLVATPPAPWTAGDAPKGGYYLDTFVRVYRDYKRFVRVYGINTSVTFKSLIGDDIEPQVRADCKLSETRYQKISDDELLALLKERLSFKEKDYYISQLEELRLPPHPITSLKLYSSFTKLSTDMLRIEDEAKQNGVKLNKHGLKNLFSKLVKDYYRLQSWFNAKKFKSLSKSVRYINGKIKKRMVEEKERDHDHRMDQATLHGVRHDYRGGKQEASDAPTTRGARGGRGRGRGNVRGGIQKSDRSSTQSRTPLSQADQAAMDAAYAVEKALPKGRYWHTPGPYCFYGPDGKCQGRVCQGCGYHSSRDQPGHDRPRCRHKSHADFVTAPKYWCECWPNRTDPIGMRPRTNPKSESASAPSPSAAKARANGVGDA